MKHPLHVRRAARAHAIDHVTVGLLEMLRPFPHIRRVADPFFSAVIPAGPRKPVAVHFHAEGHDHRLAKFARGIAPLVDVGVPLAGDDFIQAEFVRPAILGVRPVPRRPEDERHRAVPPDHIQIPGRETLFSPVTRGSNDRLVFADHRFELLDHLEGHVVFRVSEIHERAGVSAVGREQDLHRCVEINS